MPEAGHGFEPYPYWLMECPQGRSLRRSPGAPFRRLKQCASSICNGRRSSSSNCPVQYNIIDLISRKVAAARPNLTDPPPAQVSNRRSSRHSMTQTKYVQGTQSELSNWSMSLYCITSHEDEYTCMYPTIFLLHWLIISYFYCFIEYYAVAHKSVTFCYERAKCSKRE